MRTYRKIAGSLFNTGVAVQSSVVTVDADTITFMSSRVGMLPPEAQVLVFGFVAEEDGIVTLVATLLVLQVDALCDQGIHAPHDAGTGVPFGLLQHFAASRVDAQFSRGAVCNGDEGVFDNSFGQKIIFKGGVALCGAAKSCSL